MQSARNLLVLLCIAVALPRAASTLDTHGTLGSVGFGVRAAAVAGDLSSVDQMKMMSLRGGGSPPRHASPTKLTRSKRPKTPRGKSVPVHRRATDDDMPLFESFFQCSF